MWRELVDYGRRLFSLQRTVDRHDEELKEIRQECPEQGRWSFSSQQATLRRLNRVFDSFFRRVKSGQKPGYPRFRSGNRWDSVLWPSDGDRCRWRDGRVYLQGIGAVRVSVHRPAEGAVKTLAVKREGRRWYLVLVAAKSGLNRSILDAGWAQFAAILAAKAEEAGRVMVTVNPQYTSQRCHSCGHIDARNRNGVAFVCLACGHTGHADVNAARNVLRAGLARPAAHVA